MHNVETSAEITSVHKKLSKECHKVYCVAKVRKLQNDKQLSMILNVLPSKMNDILDLLEQLKK